MRTVVLDKRWMDRANCKGMDVNMFFPEVGRNMSDFVRRTCEACEVRTQCFEFATSNFIDEGIWGGTSARNRRNARDKSPIKFGVKRSNHE